MKENIRRFENVFYPVGGIANICNNISELFKERVKDKECIHLVVSAQLNSFPHIGTVINFMSAFALGVYLRKTLSKRVDVTFDALDNVSAETIRVGDDTYYISLRDKIVDGTCVADKYLPGFIDLLDRLSNKSNISYSVRLYGEYQSDPIVRKTMIKVLNNREEFAEILNPNDGRVHIRTVCPICHYGEKSAKHIIVDKTPKNELIIKNKCYRHGCFETLLAENNTEFVDINSQIRDFMKAIYLIEKGKEDNSYGIMVDGADWGGLWPLRVHVESLLKLGYRELAGRIFTPTITDWAGTKLSKRLYVGDNAFSELQEGLINYSRFFDKYGIQGFDKLWNEVNSWVETPAKFFRDYSVDYIELVLNS